MKKLLMVSAIFAPFLLSAMHGEEVVEATISETPADGRSARALDYFDEAKMDPEMLGAKFKEFEQLPYAVLEDLMNGYRMRFNGIRNALHPGVQFSRGGNKKEPIIPYAEPLETEAQKETAQLRKEYYNLMYDLAKLIKDNYGDARKAQRFAAYNDFFETRAIHPTDLEI
ncbi:MAG: hypothetical protein K2X90_01060 [Candidatus Babeliaceae bacterium]|nr:hypothetical protein [Candidatus Babeliaceae bacterium]